MFLTIKFDSATAARLDRLMNLLEAEQAQPAQQAAIDSYVLRMATSRKHLAAVTAATSPKG